MRSIVLHLIHLYSSASRSLSADLLRFGRTFSIESNRVDETLKVDEAETVRTLPPPPEKLLVLGGNGFIGSHVCKEALEQGLFVSSLSRFGSSLIHEPGANKVDWHRGSLLVPESWKDVDVLNDVTSVISVGGFGSHSHMYKINGTANINAIKAAAEKGVKRFVYVLAVDFGPVNYIMQGYF